MPRRFAFAASLIPIAILLSGCGSKGNGESAADYANKIGNADATPAASSAAAAKLPKPTADGKKAIAFTTPYTQVDSSTGARRGLTINPDGTFELVENGQAVHGTYQWLPDGKRLRLNGVAERPIVLIANGAIYRLTNENVPLDDLTPDRMYAPAVK